MKKIENILKGVKEQLVKFSMISMLCLLLTPLSFAQTQEASFQYQDQTLGKFLSRQLRKIINTDAYSQHPQKFYAAGARFVVDSAGIVRDVMIFISNSERFAEEVKKMIYATSGHWKARREAGKAVESQPIFMPFILTLDSQAHQVEFLDFEEREKLKKYFEEQSYLILWPECKDSHCRTFDLVQAEISIVH